MRRPPSPPYCRCCCCSGPRRAPLPRPPPLLLLLAAALPAPCGATTAPSSAPASAAGGTAPPTKAPKSCLLLPGSDTMLTELQASVYHSQFLQLAALADTYLGAADSIITLLNTTSNVSYTVFAPDDAAFAALPPNFFAMLRGGSFREFLVRTLKVHLAIDGPQYVCSLPQGTNVTLDTLLPGNQGGEVVLARSAVDVATMEPLVSAWLRVKWPEVTIRDSRASNGVVHGTDTVLVPSSVPVPRDSMTTAASTAGHTTFVALNSELRPWQTGDPDPAGLAAKLDNTGTVKTCFVPTDAAFAALGAGTVDLLKDCPGVLGEVLRFHCAEGWHDSAAVQQTAESATPLLAMMSGGAAACSDGAVPAGLSIGASCAAAAKIVGPNQLSASGLFHSIDAVLIPPGTTLPTVACTPAPTSSPATKPPSAAPAAAVAPVVPPLLGCREYPLDTCTPMYEHCSGGVAAEPGSMPLLTAAAQGGAAVQLYLFASFGAGANRSAGRQQEEVTWSLHSDAACTAASRDGLPRVQACDACNVWDAAAGSALRVLCAAPAAASATACDCAASCAGAWTPAPATPPPPVVAGHDATKCWENAGPAGGQPDADCCGPAATTYCTNGYVQTVSDTTCCADACADYYYSCTLPETAAPSKEQAPPAPSASPSAQCSSKDAVRGMADRAGCARPPRAAEAAPGQNEPWRPLILQWVSEVNRSRALTQSECAQPVRAACGWLCPRSDDDDRATLRLMPKQQLHLLAVALGMTTPEDDSIRGKEEYIGWLQAERRRPYCGYVGCGYEEAGAPSCSSGSDGPSFTDPVLATLIICCIMLGIICLGCGAAAVISSKRGKGGDGEAGGDAGSAPTLASQSRGAPPSQPPPLWNRADAPVAGQLGGHPVQYWDTAHDQDAGRSAGSGAALESQRRHSPPHSRRGVQSPPAHSPRSAPPPPFSSARDSAGGWAPPTAAAAAPVYTVQQTQPPLQQYPTSAPVMVPRARSSSPIRAASPGGGRLSPPAPVNRSPYRGAALYSVAP